MSQQSYIVRTAFKAWHFGNRDLPERLPVHKDARLMADTEAKREFVTFEIDNQQLETGRDTFLNSTTMESAKKIVRTSQCGWLEVLAKSYAQRQATLLIDDGGFGIDPASQTLLDMARLAKLSPREVGGVCVALGISSTGIMMLLLAFFDLDPTSKLGLLIGGGAVCVLSGGLSAIRILTTHRPPNIRMAAVGLEIWWP